MPGRLQGPSEPLEHQVGGMYIPQGSLLQLQQQQLRQAQGLHDPLRRGNMNPLQVSRPGIIRSSIAFASIISRVSYDCTRSVHPYMCIYIYPNPCTGAKSKQIWPCLKLCPILKMWDS